jgi:hypothetical protein
MNLCLLQTAQIRKHGYQVNCMKNICKFWIENWRDKKKEKNKNYLLTMYHATQTQIYPTLKLNFFYLTCLSHRKWIRKYLKPPS